MFFDCFTFYNEFDLLEVRLMELYPVVDHFVLVEATKTFQGKDKPLYFQQNKERYSKYNDKIIHIVVDNMPEGSDNWAREHFQRNAISWGLKNIRDDDIIIMSDLDEIVYRTTVENFKKMENRKDMYTLETSMYYYNLGCKYINQWCFAKIFSGKKYNQISSNLQAHRFPDKKLESIKSSGCHYSYFYSIEGIIDKLESFSHSEYNDETHKNPAFIVEKILKNKSLFDDADSMFAIEPQEDPSFLKFQEETRKFLLDHFYVPKDPMTELDELLEVSKNSFEIGQHADKLYDYAKGCTRIVECSNGSSTSLNIWPLLKGLVDNSGEKEEKEFTCCYLVKNSNVDRASMICKKLGIKFQYIQGVDTLVNLPKADLYYIDTWHVYAHLKRELNKFESLANYIVIRPTEIDAMQGESVRCNMDVQKQSTEYGYPPEEIKRGLLPAILEFLSRKTFCVDGYFVNSFGLTILKKIS